MSEEKKIKVVLLEPYKIARAVEINASLEGMQGVVGGLIEPFYPFEEQVCIVCNEESKGVFDRTAALRPLRDTSSSLIGRATEKPTTWELLSVWKTERSIPSKAIPVTPASKTVILSAAALFTATVYLPIKKYRPFAEMQSVCLHNLIAALAVFPRIFERLLYAPDTFSK